MWGRRGERGVIFESVLNIGAVLAALLACADDAAPPQTADGEAAEGAPGEAVAGADCETQCSQAFSSCTDSCTSAGLASMADGSNARSEWDACMDSQCRPADESCRAGCAAGAAAVAAAPQPPFQPSGQPDAIQAELDRQMQAIQQAGQAGAQQSAATAGNAAQPAAPAPTCLGQTQDCVYGGSPQCCAPMACLCAHGYCRCGSGPQIDNETGSIYSGGPTPPAGQPCPSADCATMVGEYPKGPGHCDGKVTGYITNNCSEAVVCKYSIAGSGRSAGMTSVPAGSKVGGGMGGIWSCGEPAGATWQYRCTTAAANAASCKW